MSLDNISVSKKLILIVAIPVIFFVGLLFLINFSLDTFSSVRAYVGAEGLWSKNQKDALINLQIYLSSKDEKYYNEFISALKVQQGDHIARIELEKTRPDYSVADGGFLQGEVNPADAHGMSLLFRRFRHVSYIDKAIQIWAEGDALIDKLRELGLAIHTSISSNTATEAQISGYYLEISTLNQQLRALEDDFSGTLGEAARWVKGVLIIALAAMSFVFILISLIMAFFIGRRITGSLDKIHEGVSIVENGDLSHSIGLKNIDEVGRLAQAFDTMTLKLQKTYAELEKKNDELKHNYEGLEKGRAELEKMNELMIGRELRMIELKKELEEMKKQKELGEGKVG